METTNFDLIDFGLKVLWNSCIALFYGVLDVLDTNWKIIVFLYPYFLKHYIVLILIPVSLVSWCYYKSYKYKTKKMTNAQICEDEGLVEILCFAFLIYFIVYYGIFFQGGMLIYFTMKEMFALMPNVISVVCVGGFAVLVCWCWYYLITEGGDIASDIIASGIRKSK